MAISVYQPQSSVGGVADRTTSVKVDNTAERAALQQQAGIGNALLAGAKMYMDQMETADVMKANNEYNDKMSTLRNELMQNKEENALDNMNKYEEGRNKILEEIYSKGPRSVRSGLSRQKFEAGIQKDWIGQKNNMRSYMMQENEKYQDTQLGNALTRRSQDIAENWNNPAALLESVQSGEADIRERYKFYGPEKQESMILKWKGQAYGNAITTAIGKEDYDHAGVLLQGYGKYLDPNQRVSMDKIITERKRSDLMLSNVNGLFAKYGKDVNAAWAEFSKSLGTADSGAGVKNYAESQIGQNLGTNTCAIFVGKAITAAGGDTSLISTLADGTYVNYENRGLTYTDRSQLRDGDIVFWKVDGSGYQDSNDKSAIHSDTYAYKGITHVGVYDAKSGKVIQSGSHGISPMDIDTAGYHFVGAAHQPGKALSPTEMEKRRQDFSKAYMVNVNLQNYQNNLMIENAANQLLAMSKDGQPRSAKEYENIIYGMTGNNWALYSKLQPLASHFGKGGGYHELSLVERYALEEAIDQGKFSQEELLGELTKMNVKPEKAMEYIRKNKQSIAKEGKIDWSLVKNSFYEKVGGKDKVTAEDMMGVMDAARRKVEEYSMDSKTKGQKIPMDTLVGYMQDCLLTGEAGTMAGGYGEYSVARMMNKGIYRIDKRDDGKLDVYFFGTDSPFPYPLTEEQLKERMQ